jgi:hypothetical protein
MGTPIEMPAMTDAITASGASSAGTAAGSKGLASRAIGIIFSPRATYQDIADRPRVLGVLILVLAITGGALFAFMSTDVGVQSMLEQGDRMSSSFGRQMSDQQYDQARAFMERFRYVYALPPIIFIPLVAAIEAALILAIFNAIMGGDATFKQAYAIVLFSLVLTTVQQLFALPLEYVKESMASPTTLAVFLPFLDEASFLGRLLGAIDLFRIWWVVNLSIGIGVLYKRRTAPIAMSLLGLYAAVACIYAALTSALSGV